MKRLLNTTSILAVATFFASPALAADIYKGGSTKDAPVAGTSVNDNVNWSGIYVGAHAGYAWGSMDATRTVHHDADAFHLSTCTPPVTLPTGGSLDDYTDGLDKAACTALEGTYNQPRTGETLAPDFTGGRFDDKPILFDDAKQHASVGMDGWFGGADLSYKFQIHQFILEPFGDISYGGGKGSASFERDVVVKGADGKPADPTNLNLPADAFDGITETSQFSFEKRWGGTLGLKAGLLATDRDYFYGLGGLAYGSFNVKGGSQGHQGDDSVDVTSYNDTANGWGWTAGVGYERAVTDHLHFGVEGRYTQINGIDASNSNSFDIQDPNCPRGLAVNTNEKISGDYEEWSVLGRISYKIGN